MIYVMSERLKKDKATLAYGNYLSHKGNDMLRFVALVTGGEDHLAYVSEALRLLTIQEHPDHN